MADHLIEITLGRDWLEQPAGTVVRVDPGRAEWLLANGYGPAIKELAASEPPQRRGRRRRGEEEPVGVHDHEPVHGEEP